MPWPSLILVLLLAGRPPGDDPLAPDDVPEPPVAGRPANFSGAIGVFRVAAATQPTRLHAEDPMSYTLTVTAQGPFQRPPQRPRLEDLPAFTRSFLVERLPEDAGTPAPAGTWRFAYRLRPRTAEVTAVPAFPFVFYKPGVLPPSRGYQTVFVPEVPLEVSPRPTSLPVPAAPPLPQPPTMTHQLTRGPGVLRSDRPPLDTGPVILAVFLLAPPALMLGWLLVGRWRHPERTARSRHGRFAREALAALKVPGRDQPHGGRAEAERVAAVLGSYLGRRFHLSASEPSARDAAVALRQAGVADPCIQQLAELQQRVDAARFAPNGQAPPALVPLAREVILALEAAV